MNEMIPLFAVNMPSTIDEPLLKTLHSGYIGQGAKVDEFEIALSQFFGIKNILTVNSGTSALQLALRLAKKRNPTKTEVITTPMTCTATNEPIMAENLVPVWADIGKNGLIDPVDIERKVTNNTAAIMVVDWGGMPCDMDEIMRIGQKYSIPVIEDAAHAFGSTYKGRNVGTLADYTCFSFQAIKHLTTVDGGLLITQDTEDYKKGKLLRWYGIDRESDRKDFRCEEDIVDWGYKFHMNDVAATIGIEQLKVINAVIANHQANAGFYKDTLVHDFPKVVIPQTAYPSGSSYWLFTILLANKETRLRFMKFMNESGVMVSQVHARNDKHTMFKGFEKTLPGVDEFVDRQVSIPVHFKLTQDDKNKIVNLIKLFE